MELWPRAKPDKCPLGGNSADVHYVTSDGLSGDEWLTANTASDSMSVGYYYGKNFSAPPDPGYMVVQQMVATATFSAPGFATVESRGFVNVEVPIPSGNAPLPIAPPANPPQATYSVAASSDVLDKKTQDFGTYTFTRTGDLSQEAVAYYTVSGTAEPGTDYEFVDGNNYVIPGGVVAFPPGKSTVAVRIMALDNPSDDDDGAGDPPQLSATVSVLNVAADGDESTSSATIQARRALNAQRLPSLMTRNRNWGVYTMAA